MVKKEKKEKRVTIRLSMRDFRRVEWLAGQYAGGNIAKWVRHGALEAERKFLK